MDPVVATEPSGAPADPNEVILNLADLPPELQPAPIEPTEPSAAPAVATEPAADATVAPVTEPVQPVAASAAPVAGRASAVANHADLVTRRRAAYAAAQARVRQPERIEPPTRLNDAPDLDTAFQREREYLERKLEARDHEHRVELETVKVTLSQGQMRREAADYDQVIQASGVGAAITINPETGLAPDMALNRAIMTDPDPARAAYAYAKSVLEARGGAPAPVTEPTVASASAVEAARREGRREVVTSIAAAANRPRGIGRLTGTGTATGQGLTRAQIAGMSDDQKALIKAKYPHAWARYLGEPQSA